MKSEDRKRGNTTETKNSHQNSTDKQTNVNKHKDLNFNSIQVINNFSSNSKGELGLSTGQ